VAQAGVLVTMLANVAAHHSGFVHWGMKIDDVRISVGRQVYWATTGQKPPSP
jgi:hypothetical protein